MRLIAYLDESGTHDDSPVMTMAGYVGHAGQWRKFDKKWKHALSGLGLTYFHAVDFVKRRGEFKLDDRSYLACVDAVDRLANQTAILGFVACLKRPDFETVYRAEPLPTKIPADTQYGVCFRICLSFLAMTLPDAMGNREFVLDIVMEAGHKNMGDAERIYALFKKGADPALSKSFGTLTFADKLACCGAQLADSLAYAGYRNEQRPVVPVTSVGRERGSFAISEKRAEAQGMRPLYRLDCNEPLLLELRENLLAQVRARMEIGKRGPRAVST